MSRGMKNIHWLYSVGDEIKTDRQDFIITNKEIRDKIIKSKTSYSGFCHNYQKWYEYTCKKCNTENLWIQEKGIKENNGCPICNKIRQKTNTPWLYKVGQKIIDDKRDLIITDRKVITRTQKSNTTINGYSNHFDKYYKYHCNLCGYDDGWKLESALKAGQGCPVCCSPSKIVVTGINDISTTDPWMIPYFQGGYEEAKLYSKGSNTRLNFKCPDCGKIKSKKIAISTLYSSRSIGCECSDKTSYPEKFFASFLNQLHIPFERQFVFKGSKYRYDFIIYSIKKDKLFIVETDGRLGHGELTWGGKDIQKSRESLLRDMDKIIFALSYKVPVVKIDCSISDKNYISNSISNNIELKEYIDFDTINWDECDKYAMKNIVKEICYEFNDNNDIEYLSKKYKTHPATIKIYINKGKEYGWVNEINETGETYNKIFSNNKKYVAVYKNDKLILVYKNVMELCRNSIELLGIKLNEKSVYGVCLGYKKQNKGFIFKYISKEEYDKLLKQLETN